MKTVRLIGLMVASLLAQTLCEVQAAPVTPDASPLLASVAAVRVDETGTTLSTPTTQLRWRSFGPGKERDNQVEATVRVALRLNLTPWVGKNIRLYQRMTNGADSGQFYVSWRGQGRLLPGTLNGGGRVLVFEGVVKDPFLLDTLDVSITGDGRNLAGFQAVELFFEVDK
jgi:hypothetical protein